MRSYSASIAIYAFAFSCTVKTDTADVELHPDYLESKFAVGDSTIAQSYLWACFCNLTNSAIRINNISNGFEGQKLTVAVTKSDTIFSFRTWTCVGGQPEYYIEKQALTMDHSTFLLQDSLTGKIIVAGTFNENDKKVDFRIAGHFKCIVRDSLYGFVAYQADINEIINKGGPMKQTDSNPHSVLKKD